MGLCEPVCSHSASLAAEQLTFADDLCQGFVRQQRSPAPYQSLQGSLFPSRFRLFHLVLTHWIRDTCWNNREGCLCRIDERTIDKETLTRCLPALTCRRLPGPDS